VTESDIWSAVFRAVGPVAVRRCLPLPRVEAERANSAKKERMCDIVPSIRDVSHFAVLRANISAVQAHRSMVLSPIVTSLLHDSALGQAQCMY
jgi:hypothetical protein